jgi:hypothetical protein
MLHALLALHEFQLSGHKISIQLTRYASCRPYHSGKPFPSFLRPKQESSASFEEECHVLNVDARKVVEAYFEHVEDQVKRNDPELGQIREKHQILPMG